MTWDRHRDRSPREAKRMLATAPETLITFSTTKTKHHYVVDVVAPPLCMFVFCENDIRTCDKLFASSKYKI
jgi:hypothetical protein